MLEFSFIPDLVGIGPIIPALHGGADVAGGGLIGLLETVLNGLSKATEPEGGFQWFPGILALGLNVHPALVHFPIAFLSGFFVLELLGIGLPRERLRQTASAMLYCGALGALLAATAGLYAAYTVPHGQDVHDIMEWHERLGLSVAGLALILSIWRGVTKHPPLGMARGLFLLLSTLMMAGLVFGADLGALMVYEHGVAVHQLQQAVDVHQHHHEKGAGEDSEH